jgi:arylsulfatase
MSTSSRPNLLFLFPDQWRWDWLGCETSPFGKVPVKTPNLDALGARGVRFTQCRTNSPLCAPARAALVTGMRYHRCGVASNGTDCPPDADTYLRRLRDAGYRVAATGKTDLQKHGQWKGLDGWTDAMGRLGFTECVNQAGKHDAVNSGFPAPQDPYMAYLHSVGQAEIHRDDYRARKQLRKDGGMDFAPTPLAREHYTDDFAGRMAERFLDRWAPAPNGRSPWHLWVNFPGPHEPFDPPAELLARYEGVAFPPPIAGNDSADHQAVRRSYAAMISGIDDWVGRLLAAVERRGELGSTLVVFASDHGEMLGDHGRWFKNTWHEPSVHVPLIVAGPGVSRGVCHRPVELIDLAATLLDAAGVAAPPWDARSLAPLLADPTTAHRSVTHAALGDWRSVTDGRWKLVAVAGQADRLFDLHADPTEQADVAAAHPELLHRLQAALADA